MNAKLILIPFLIAIISIAYTSSDVSTTTSTTKNPEDKPKDDKQGNNTLKESAPGNSTKLESNESSGNSTDDVNLQFGRPHFRNNKEQHRKKGKKNKKKHHKKHQLSGGDDFWGDDSEKLIKS